MIADVQSTHETASAARGGVAGLVFGPECARFSLRIDPEHLARAGGAFGADIPARIGQRAARTGRSALCLGPDEWLLHADESAREEIAAAFGALYAGAPHSLVDISDRERAIELHGPGATSMLAAGCPLDLSQLRVGCGTRTVFDSVQVVLVREAEERFLIEVWRSFCPHVWELLTLAGEELALGI